MRDSDRDRPFWPVVSMGRSGLEEPGLALVVLSVVEQRLDAVRAVLAGATAVEVAAEVESASDVGRGRGGDRRVASSASAVGFAAQPDGAGASSASRGGGGAGRAPDPTG